jgi:Zn-dependent M28 family amino/carboxypeptidase
VKPRRPSTPLLLLTLLVLAAALLPAIVTAACGNSTAAAIPSSSPTLGPSPPATFGVEAYAALAALDRIGARPTGSIANVTTRDLIYARLQGYGYRPKMQPFTAAGTTTANVIADRRGVADPLIVIGAHYDSSPLGKGALDNASGVSLALELADRLVHSKVSVSVRFVFFGAEENGFLGSKYYVATLSEADRTRTFLMIDLDTVAGGDHLYVYSGTGTSAWPRTDLQSLAHKLHIDLRTSPAAGKGHPAGTVPDSGDYAAFRGAGIPFAWLEAADLDVGDHSVFTSTAREGVLRHTTADNLAHVDHLYPGRLKRQLGDFATVLERYIVTMKVKL